MTRGATQLGFREASGQSLAVAGSRKTVGRRPRSRRYPPEPLLCCTVFDPARHGALRALVVSLRQHHPNARMLALGIGDAVDIDLEDVEILRLEDLAVERPWVGVALTPVFLRDAVLA